MFRGVFCRDTLPKSGPKMTEMAVVNLDLSTNPGTHWVAYSKRGKRVTYFDSFGNLPPPLELQRYFKGCTIVHNYSRCQNFDEVNCGHLCLEFLIEQQQQHDNNGNVNRCGI